MKLIAAIALALLVAGCQSASILRDIPKYW